MNLVKRQLTLPQLLIATRYPVQIPERMVWTSSSLKLFRKCPRKFFWKYMMRLRPQGRDKALLIGGGFHNCLWQWYHGKRSSMRRIARQVLKRLHAAAEASAPFMDQKDYDDTIIALQTFVGMVVGYATHYKTDRFEWRIERGLIEKKFLVNCGRFDYSGMIDLVHRYGRRGYKFVEHKTSAKIQAHYIERLPLDTQVRGYVFGLRKGLGVPVTDVVYDVVEKCKIRRKTNETMDDFIERIASVYINQPQRYFHREDLKFDDVDVDTFEYELHQTNSKYERILAGDFGDPKNPRSWEANDGACDDWFRLCPYHGLCIQGLDRASGSLFEIGEHLHEELADAD